jgi:hypothetical protein
MTLRVFLAALVAATEQPTANPSFSFWPALAESDLAWMEAMQCVCAELVDEIVAQLHAHTISRDEARQRISAVQAFAA